MNMMFWEYLRRSGRDTPDKEIYKIAMDMQKVKPEESVFVGDGGSDELYGAKRAENIMLSADYHMNDFDKLLTIIK